MSTRRIVHEYESSHPWIKFKINLESASPKLWMDLGEAASKCEHIAGAPLDPDTRDELLKLYMAKGANATTAIEGNTLTENQVLDHLNGKLELPPSQDYLAQEVDNVIGAANKIIKDMLGGKSTEITVAKINLYNKMVLKKLPVEGHVKPGETRQCSVLVGGRYRGAPWQDCGYLLQRFCEWMNGTDFQDSRLPPIILGIIKAIVAHVYLAWIHPFGDGNGRTARLLELHMMLAARVPVPACQLLSNHYNHTRSMYYNKLDEISRNGGDLVPFITYAVRGLTDQLKVQIGKIQQCQLELAWHARISAKFDGKNSQVDARRRQLVVDLSYAEEPIAIPAVRELSTHLAAAYANKTNRAILRDLRALEDMELVEFMHNERQVRARTDDIRAFIPNRRTEHPVTKRRSKA